MPRVEFESKGTKLKEDMRRLLESYFSKEQASKMCKHVQGLNRPTFRQTVREMTESLGLPVSNNELNKVIGYRNELVHRMRFFEDEESYDVKGNRKDSYRAYLTIMNYVGKLLLAILRYRGCYLDWTKDAVWESEMRTPLPLNENMGNWPDVYD